MVENIEDRYETSRILNRRKRIENIDNYMKNPKVCPQCGKTIPYDSRINKFCSHSCRAIYVNSRRMIKFIKGKPVIRKIIHECEFCGELTTRPKFCSMKCWGLSTIEYNFIHKKGNAKHSIRRYLIYLRGHKCEVCNNTKWGNNDIPLEAHHINGKYNDNTLENLQLICPNCHAFTDNFKGKNKGNGRPYDKYR